MRRVRKYYTENVARVTHDYVGERGERLSEMSCRIRRATEHLRVCYIEIVARVPQDYVV